MRRIGHGDTFGDGGAAIAAELAVPVDETFGRMFPHLVEDPSNLLEETDDTVAALKALGDAMRDFDEGDPIDGPGGGDSDIPAAFTYFGQFLDHDITFDAKGLPVADMADSSLRPRPDLDGLTNGRSIRLDLDCLYGGDAPRDGDGMLLGPVSPFGGGQRPAGKGDFNDLPREARSDTQKDRDRAARIGDARNDENLIVSQLHVAFLKAHNALVADGRDFASARRGMRQRFQLIVLDDFLPRICDPAVVADVRANGSGWNLGFTGALFMPVEFSAAAYRFGHSMIRTRYNYNTFFENAGLDLLFTFTALSGNIGPFPLPAGEGSDTLPENWIIEWDRLIAADGTSQQLARQINTQLSDFTFDLRNTFGETDDGGSADPEVVALAPILAKRNLLRGYILRLPTGQAVARELGLTPLEGQALLDALPTAELRAAAEPFKDRTPLWFYILAEAGDPAGPNGARLGAAGSRIVCDAFAHFIRVSEDSVLDPQNPPEIPGFTLAELIVLAFRDEQA